MPSDAERFLDAVARSKSIHQPWLAPPRDAQAFGAYLERIRSDDCYGFLVCLETDDCLVGTVNLNEVVRGCFQSAYLAYYVFHPYERKGLMTEGLKLVLQYAFTSLGLHRLEANIQPENSASIALAKRCGFEKEGYSKRYLKIGDRWRDHERWAILKETCRS